MADKGIASLSASILPDSIKTRLSGVLTYEPSVTLTASTGEAWVYKEHLVTSSDTAIFAVTDDYIAGKSAGAVGGTAVDTDDKIRWICIEHTGTINGSVATAEGVMLGLNETSAYNLTNGIFNVMIKFPASGSSYRVFVHPDAQEDTTIIDFHLLRDNYDEGV